MYLENKPTSLISMVQLWRFIGRCKSRDIVVVYRFVLFWLFFVVVIFVDFLVILIRVGWT